MTGRERQTLDAPGAPAAIGPYSHAVRAGGPAVVLGADSAATPAARRDHRRERGRAGRALPANLSAVCEAAGTSLSRAVRLTVYMTDLGAFAEVNEVYARFFETEPPARVAIGVAALPRGAQVEIDAVVALALGRTPRSSARLTLPLAVFGSSARELDDARVLVGRGLALDVLLQLAHELGGGLRRRRRAAPPPRARPRPAPRRARPRRPPRRRPGGRRAPTRPRTGRSGSRPRRSRRRSGPRSTATRPRRDGPGRRCASAPGRPAARDAQRDRPPARRALAAHLLAEVAEEEGRDAGGLQHQLAVLDLELARRAAPAPSSPARARSPGAAPRSAGRSRSGRSRRGSAGPWPAPRRAAPRGSAPRRRRPSRAGPAAPAGSRAWRSRGTRWAPCRARSRARARAARGARGGRSARRAAAPWRPPARGR